MRYAQCITECGAETKKEKSSRQSSQASVDRREREAQEQSQCTFITGMAWVRVIPLLHFGGILPQSAKREETQDWRGVERCNL